MPAPDLIAPDRLEELLGGALPEGEREARLQGLVRELRAEAPPAPPTLLERVREIGHEQPRRRRLDFLPRRQVVALAALIVVLAGFAGLLSQVDAGGDDDEAAAPVEEFEVSDAGDAEAPATPTVPMFAPSPAPSVQQSREDAPAWVQKDSGDVTQEAAGQRAATLGSQVPELSSNRATDVKLWMEVRLADAEELSDAANDSMTITRELGGWVAATEIDTQGNEGRAELALRVPVTRVEDAIVRLGELGTVTGQQVETVDLQAAIDRREARIENVLRAIRALELRLETEDLTPAQEIEIKLDLADRRNELADLRRANRSDRREAATSELTLVLHTREAPAAREEDEGGAAGAADDALRFLADAGTIALFLVIVLSPVVLLAVLIWLALRSRTRRIETRILERQTPSAPPAP
ncbi:MAG TPA: DUF4349 domain-containing protein [Gaiellaceae bacterium]|nr:DUF4349 domain-containing protein [Gaiellaceae bacterium]